MLVLKNSTEAFARRQAGGKGFNLYQMTRLDLPVPEWVVLGRNVYEQFVREAGIGNVLSKILAEFEAGKLDAGAAAVRAERLIVGAGMPPSVRTWIDRAYEAVGRDATISVRSSAADEDGAAHSFAGQLSSYLYVSGTPDAAKFVPKCWASCFSARALAYRRENGLSLQGLAVAVVFQRMIDPEVSGVLFTCDPANRDLATYVVSAVYGVGEGLVSGALDADTFWLDAETGAVKRQEIAAKAEAFRRGVSGECRRAPVDEAARNEPCLAPDQLRELHRLGRQLVEFYGRPQDVEWAIAGGRLYVLQTRAVTTLEENLTGYPNLWDNSNIVESYGGPTSPLSFTFALHNYKGVYVQFCEILGVPRSVVNDMEYYLGNMLGCINGRVYYNLYNWYKLVGVLPGFSQNRQFMETMMGVREQLSAEIADRIRPHPSWDTLRGRFRKLVTGLAFVVYHVRIQKIVDDFLADFGREYGDFRHRDYARMSSD
ncbi:MAG: PEP/pyruvate-binding domain-containing protein [Verrucomicrobiota bacterium]